MNIELTKHIINHIFLSFSIIENNNLDFKKYSSIKSPSFCSDKKISFEDEFGKSVKNNLWGIQISFEDTFIKIFLADCTINKNNQEYAMILKSEENIAYGIYLAYEQNNFIDPLFSIVDDNSNWSEASISMQASLLSVLENLKYVQNTVDTAKVSMQDYSLISDFVNHYNKFYGYSYEG